jgi:hypothetical protein
LEYPLIDAASNRECFQLLDDLKDRGYIWTRQHSGYEYLVILQPSGREYLEEVSRQIVGEMDYAAMPEAARHDLMKAATRYKAGELSGALAAACGAVDSACARVYEEHGLGAPAKESFQQRVMKSLREKNVFQRLESELSAIGWDNNDARQLAKNLEGSLNQAAYVMQTLRSKMSDVHGSKPVLEAVVFDSLKWATIIAAQLK